MARFVYVTDLHGVRWKYERALALARERGARLLLNGGDMLPHGRIHGEQARFIREFLVPLFAACQDAGVRFLFIPGNDDLRAHDGLLEEACAPFPLVSSVARRKVEAEGYEFIGLDLVTDFPFRLKDRARMDTRDAPFPPQPGTGVLSVPGGWEEIPDWDAHARGLPTLADELAALPLPRDPRRAVYVLHGPPSGLGLDVVRGGEAVGSRATRAFIESVKPLLTLHGHIHESPAESGTWLARLGPTTCLQPGQSGAGLTAVAGDLGTAAYERRVLAPGG